MSRVEMEHECPFCGRKNDLASGPFEQEPAPGDYTICWGCRTVGAFDADLRVRALTEEERTEIETDPRLRALRSLVEGSRTPREAVKRWEGLS